MQVISTPPAETFRRIKILKVNLDTMVMYLRNRKSDYLAAGDLSGAAITEEMIQFLYELSIDLLSVVL